MYYGTLDGGNRLFLRTTIPVQGGTRIVHIPIERWNNGSVEQGPLSLLAGKGSGIIFFCYECVPAFSYAFLF